MEIYAGGYVKEKIKNVPKVNGDIKLKTNYFCFKNL